MAKKGACPWLVGWLRLVCLLPCLGPWLVAVGGCVCVCVKKSQPRTGVCAFVCAFVPAVVCSFRGLFAVCPCGLNF